MLIALINITTFQAHLFATLSGCHGNIGEIETCLVSVEAQTLVLNQWKMHFHTDAPQTTREYRIARLYNRRFNPEVCVCVCVCLF